MPLLPPRCRPGSKEEPPSGPMWASYHWDYYFPAASGPPVDLLVFAPFLVYNQAPVHRRFQPYSAIPAQGRKPPSRILLGLLRSGAKVKASAYFSGSALADQTFGQVALGRQIRCFGRDSMTHPKPRPRRCADDVFRQRGLSRRDHPSIFFFHRKPAGDEVVQQQPGFLGLADGGLGRSWAGSPRPDFHQRSMLGRRGWRGSEFEGTPPAFSDSRIATGAREFVPGSESTICLALHLCCAA